MRICLKALLTILNSNIRGKRELSSLLTLLHLLQSQQQNSLQLMITLAQFFSLIFTRPTLIKIYQSLQLRELRLLVSFS
jgi:hypothetical protein